MRAMDIGRRSKRHRPRSPPRSGPRFGPRSTTQMVTVASAMWTRNAHPGDHNVTRNPTRAPPVGPQRVGAGGNVEREWCRCGRNRHAESVGFTRLRVSPAKDGVIFNDGLTVDPSDDVPADTRVAANSARMARREAR